MSLIEPNFFLRYKTWLIYGGLAVLLIGMVAGFYSWGSDYFFKRDIDKKKEAVNATIEQIKQVDANIAAEKKTAAELAANLKVATNAYFEATNTTDASRQTVNAAIDRMEKAANANVGNVNAGDVENAMRGL